jgi:cytochrome P450
MPSDNAAEVSVLAEREGVDFDFFNGPHAYRAAAEAHARDGGFYSRHGFWVLTTYRGIAEAYKNEDDFTVGRVSAAEGAAEERWIPLTVVGAEHSRWRQLLAPWFTPQRIRAATPGIRANAARRIDRFADRGEISFSEEFARPFVLENLMSVIGWPMADLDHLLAINRSMIAMRDAEDPREAFRSEQLGLPALEAAVRHQIARRRAEPADDLTTATFEWTIEDEPITDEDRASLLSTLFLAGVDSTVNHLANAIQHLACDRSARQEFLARPEVHAAAVEEFLRVNSCMYPGRMAATDQGCPAIRRGDTVLLPLAVANHDPEVFPNPGVVDFDRPENPHIAFGTGRHQCVGAALARSQIAVALEEWHARIPSYGPGPDVDPSAPPFRRNNYDLRLTW